MKILHIINNLDLGGAQKLVEDCVPIMNQSNIFKVDVLLLDDRNNVFGENLKSNKVKVDVIPFKKIYSFKNIFFLRGYLVKGNYDIVHVHLFPSTYWVSLSLKLIFKRKPKLIITEHSTHNKRREFWFLRYLEKYIYLSYDKCISISGKTQEGLISWLRPSKKNRSKFCIVNNGVNLTRFNNAKPYLKSEIKTGFTNSTKLICMAGRFSQQKDQITLIESMKWANNDTHLLLIGEGSLKQKCQDFAREIRVFPRVHFLGFRSDVDRIFKSVDIIVLSSNWEGFGLVAVEGMAAGKPVIASNVPGLREVVADGGILFPAGHSEELSKIINDLLLNENQYKEISEKCSKRSTLFGIESMVDEYISCYLDVINDKRPTDIFKCDL